MLLNTRELQEYRVQTQNGDIGSAADFYFEERQWSIRFIVCDTAALFGRNVLIPPQAFGVGPDDSRKVLPICATKETIKNSPQVNTGKPLSRAQEHILDRYYSWHISPENEITDSLFAVPFTQASLHRAGEILGYRLKTRDGELASVEDIIIDGDGWTVRYLMLQAGLWLAGKKFIIDPQIVEEVDWTGNRVFADIPSEKIRTAPEYNPALPLNPEYEHCVREHFGPPKFSTTKALEEIIRRKARELYDKRGAVPGNDWADWFEAERLVKEELNRLIQKKTQELYVRRGRKPGEEWHDWLEAKRLIEEEIKRKPS